jgi:hypothetical protein
MLKRTVRTRTVTGITLVAAALVALSATGASASSAAPAASTSHAINASATNAHAHAQGVLYSIHRGLVKDCVEIQVGGLQIWDEGAYNAVELSPAPASCWNLINEFGVDFGGTTYIGYEYQDLRGDCLWDDGGLIRTSAVCTDLANYESFFGIHYYSGVGWTVTDAYWGPSHYLATDSPLVQGDYAYIAPSSSVDAHFWNFP